MKGFIDFVREQGIIGLAIGFLLGGSVSKVVTSLVQDIVNPFLGIVLGSAGNLSDMSFTVGQATVRWGSFIASFIDFATIASVVYVLIRIFKFDKLDKKKDAK